MSKEQLRELVRSNPQLALRRMGLKPRPVPRPSGKKVVTYRP